jgi:hypothetical protein
MLEQQQRCAHAAEYNDADNGVDADDPLDTYQSDDEASFIARGPHAPHKAVRVLH